MNAIPGIQTKKMKWWSKYLFVFVSCVSIHAYGEQFPLGPDDLIGELTYTYAKEEDTLLDIARSFDIGHDQIIKANPIVNRWLPGKDTRIVIPSRYILPKGEREGIVLNLPEHRLYFYSPDKESVYTFPISIGRMDWKTPLGETKVIRKEKDPVWTPTESIRIEHEMEGDILPKSIPGGDPENPLGRFALRLGVPGYLIHGTDERKSFGIGMQVTHGCVRMYPEDIEKLFALVPQGTKVRIQDEPIKIGRREGRVFLEVHKPLDPDEYELQEIPSINLAIDKIETEVESTTKIDIEAVRRVFNVGNGVPSIISEFN